MNTLIEQNRSYIRFSCRNPTIEHGAVSKIENQKSSESTGSSSGEISERGNTKIEKSHQKITLTTIEKRGIQEVKLGWRRFTQYIKTTPNIDLNEMTTERISSG